MVLTVALRITITMGVDIFKVTICLAFIFDVKQSKNCFLDTVFSSYCYFCYLLLLLFNYIKYLKMLPKYVFKYKASSLISYFFYVDLFTLFFLLKFQRFWKKVTFITLFTNDKKMNKHTSRQITKCTWV